MSESPLPRGVVTGLGPVVGTQSDEAARLVIGELSELPHIPELPARGPWAESVGRSAALLVDLPLELDVDRWRAAPGVGRDLARARSMLAQDLDAVEEHWAGYAGSAKLQVCGPLTLMASIELRSGDAFVADPVARDDLAASLVEGVISHIAELRRRVPEATWCVQLDEPRAQTVTRGEVARPSGWGTVPAVEIQDATTLLRRAVDAVHGVECGVVVNTCVLDPEWRVITGSDADGIIVDVGRTDRSAGGAARQLEEQLERWWAGGAGLWCAVDPGDGNGVGKLRELSSLVGAAPDAFADRVVLTPRCGAAVSAAAYAELRALNERFHQDLNPDLTTD
ncbi:MAG TPA: methionine synthase [Actinomycetes bacterium]|nr:methionine synthase [Actinomycetes bacterium]